MTVRQLIIELLNYDSDTQIYLEGEWQSDICRSYYEQVTQLSEVEVPYYRTSTGATVPFSEHSSLPQDGEMKILILESL